MKKLLVLVLLFFGVFSFVWVNAFEIKWWEEISIQEEVNDDLYVAGGRVEVVAPVNWDLVISGWELIIESDVKEDLIIAWWNITISWNVWDDVRVAWWNIVIEGNVAWDLVVWGWDVRVKDWVVIWGDLVVWAWRLTLDWDVMWKAKISVWEFILNWMISSDAEVNLEKFRNNSGSGVINWNVIYRGRDEMPSLESSIKWEVVFEKNVIREDVKKSAIWFLTSYLIVKVLGLFLFASLIYLYFAKFFSNVSDNLRKETWKSFLYGFLVMVWTPVVIILLFITVVGFPFGLLFLFAYIFMFVFLWLLNTMVISSIFIDKYKVKELYKKLLIIFWFTLLFWLTNWVNPIVWLFTVWALGIKKLEVCDKIRKGKI